MTSIANIKLNETRVINHLDSSIQKKKRFFEMGLLPNTEITLINKAPFKGPVMIKVKDYSLSLRLCDASKIFVNSL